MRLIPRPVLALALLTLTFTAPVRAQEPRLFEGLLQIEVTETYDFSPYFLVLFEGYGEGDPLGNYTASGYYIFNGADLSLSDGFAVFSTTAGDLYVGFEGAGVFTGRWNGVLYVLGGTGVYENAYGYAELGGQFWRRNYTVGDATFSFIGEIWY